jgi:protein TonB
MRARRRTTPTRFVHVKVPAPPEQHRDRLAAWGVFGSVVVHGAIWALIVMAAARPKVIEESTPIEIAVVEKEKPPPPPPPPPEEKKEEPKKPDPPKVVKKAVPVPKEAPPPPPKQEELPPPPNEPPPPDAKPQAPIMIGISMSSTTTAGGFAAPVGNTLYGSAPKVAPNPTDVKPYTSPTGRYVPPAKVTRLPELVADVKAEYPPEARKLDLEGQVVLRLTIGADGKVEKATLIKGAGHGFDEAALKAVERFRFKPGTEGDEPIVTEITYTYTFILE